MSLTLGVGPFNTNNSSASTTCVISVPGTTAGNSLIVGATFASSSSITSITCTGESNFTLDAVQSSVINSFTIGWQFAWLIPLTSGGDKTVTINFAGSMRNAGFCVEVVGGDASSFHGTTNTVTTGNDAAPTSTITTATANEAVFAICSTTDGSVATASGGFTSITIGTSQVFNKGEYKLDVGGAGGYATPFICASQHWGVIAASFRSGSKGASPSVGSLAFSGIAPSVVTSLSAVPTVGGLSLSGVAPTAIITIPGTATPLPGILSLTGVAPIVGIGISPSVANLSFSGIAPSVFQSLIRIASVGSLSFTGFAPSLLQDSARLPSSAALSITGLAPTVLIPPVIAFNLPVRTLNAYGVPGIDAAFNLPVRTLLAAGKAGQIAAAAFNLPVRTFLIYANQGSAFTIPVRTLSAGGVVGAFGSVVVTLPVRTLSAHGIASILGSAAFSLPLRRLSAAGITGMTATAQIILPVRTFSVNAYAGVVGTATFDLFVRTLETLAHPQLTGSATFSLPMRYFDIAGFATPAEVYRSWVMNTRTRALTEYEGFDFNSMAKFANGYLAAGPDGLFVVGDDGDDNGEDIDALLRTGLNNYDSSMLKRVPRIYWSGTQDGDLYFSTITTEDGRRKYNLVDNTILGEQQRRVPVGQGPKSVRWQFEVQNKDGSDFSTSGLLVFPKVLKRRIK